MLTSTARSSPAVWRLPGPGAGRHRRVNVPRAADILPPFELERYLAAREFSCQYPLCCSDCEPLGMSELVQMCAEDGEVMEMWEDTSLAYTEPQGHPVLRREIASQLYRTLSAEDILTAAPEELIYLTMTSLLGPGSTMVVTFPGYQALYEVARGRGCEIRMWMPRKDGTGRWRFDVSDLEALMDDSVTMLTINFPHNPTGDLLSEADMRRVVELAADNDAWLFSDEMYRGLELEPSTRMPSAVDLASTAGSERVIALSGLSKTYSCPGLRTGWLASPDRASLKRIEGLKDYTTICGSAPGEILSIMALRQHERIASGNRELIRTNVVAADGFFEKRADVFEWHSPTAGSIAYPRLKRCPQGIEAWTEALLQEAGVMLLPATVYGHEESKAQHHFRLGLGRRNFKACLGKLGEFVDAQHAA